MGYLYGLVKKFVRFLSAELEPAPVEGAGSRLNRGSSSNPAGSQSFFMC